MLGLVVWAASLVVPGSLLLKAMGKGHSWTLAMLFSLVCIYFSGLFTTLLLHRFEQREMLFCLGGLTLLFSVACSYLRRTNCKEHFQSEPSFDLPIWLCAGLLAVGSVFFWKTWADPLSGADTFFRWHLLPQLMLHTGDLSYYPPVDRADYAWYFFPDRIAPWVAIQYAWFYTCLGHVEPRALSMLLLIVAGLIVAATSRAVPPGAKGAPNLVILLLLASPWLFWGIAIGQETGWIVLGVAATAYAWSRARLDPHWTSALPPALTIQAAVQAREYGPVFIAVGLLLGLMYEANRRQIIIYTLIASVCVLPWQFHLAARGVLSLPFLSWGSVPASNALIAGYFEHVQSTHALWQRTPRELLSVFWFLVKGGLPILCGAIMVWIAYRKQFRPMPWLAAASLVLGLWALSVGFTSGGHIYAVRVACPLWILLALSCHHFGDQSLSRLMLSPGRRILLVSSVTLAATLGAGAPFTPWMVGGTAWVRHAFGLRPSPLLVDPAALTTSPVLSVLTDNAYAHAADLASVGAVRAIPPWIPELAWMHDGSTTVAEARSRLAAMKIINSGHLSQSADSAYWRRYPLYKQTVSAP